MTELLEQAIDALRRLPQETQDAFARLLLVVLPGGSVYRLSAEDRGEFVPAAEMEMFWAEWSGKK